MKLTSPESRLNSSKGRSVPKQSAQERAARKAAIESAKARYILMECGHYTSLESFESYLHCRPRRGYAFCESACGKWRKIAKPVKPKLTPQEPMF